MKVDIDFLDDKKFELPCHIGPDGNLYIRVKPVTQRLMGRSEKYASNSKKTRDAIPLRNIPGMPSNCYGRHERNVRVMTLSQIAFLLKNGSGSATRLITGMDGSTLAERLLSFFADGHALVLKSIADNEVDHPVLVQVPPEEDGAMPVSEVMRKLSLQAREYYKELETETPCLRSKKRTPIRDPLETPPLTDSDSPHAATRPEEMDVELDPEDGLDEGNDVPLPCSEANRMKDFVRIYNVETHKYEFYSKVQSSELENMIKERVLNSSAWVQCAMIAMDCKRCQEDRM